MLYHFLHESILLAPDERVACFLPSSEATACLTYSSLRQISDEIAAILERYAQGHAVIGLCVKPSCIIPAILLGILKAGKAFCCLGETCPSSLFLSSCLVSIIIADADINLSVDHEVAVEWISKSLKQRLKILNVFKSVKSNRSESAVYLNDIAYVAFTSGSTGMPKPVFVTHKSIAPNIVDFKSLWNTSETDVIAMLSPLTFDPSIVDILCSLSSAATLCIVHTEKRLGAAALTDVLLDCGITIFQMTPSMFGLFTVSDLELLLHSPRSKIRVISLGGEHFPYSKMSSIPSVLSRWLQAQDKQNKLINLYGVTEVSCWCAFTEINYHSLNRDDDIPDILTPLSDSTMLTTIPLRQAPKCRQKELAISSLHRHCYVGSEIVDCPRSEGFVRRTGDLVVPLKRGGFKIVGRVDDVVKRFGVKVHTNILEQCVAKFLGTSAQRVVAVTLNRKSHRTEMNICLFVNPEHDVTSSEENIKLFIREKLGQIYVPENIHFTKLKVPLTLHGKVSRVAVKAFFEQPRLPCQLFSKSATHILREMWKETTSSSPSTDSYFINDGGNSIGVIRICETIRKAMPDANLVKLAEMLLTKTHSEVENYLNTELETPSLETTTVVPSTVTSSEYVVNGPITPIGPFCLVARAGNCYSNQLLLSDSANEAVKADGQRCKMSIVWRTFMEKCIDGSPILKISGQGDKVKVFIASHSGLVRCLDASSGDVIWEYRAQGRIEASVAVSRCGNFVIFGCYNNSIIALKSDSGQLHFKTDTDDIVKCTAAVDFDSSSSASDFVFIGCHDGALYVLEPCSGVLAAKLSFSSGAILASPMITTASVVVCTLQGKVFCIDKKTFDVSWRVDVGFPIFSTPALDEGIALIAAVTGTLLGLYVSTGQETWKICIKANCFAPLAHLQHSVLVSAHVSADQAQDSVKPSTSGSLFRIDCKSGAILWQFSTAASITGAPFVANGLAFVFDTKGLCYTIDSNTGRLISSCEEEAASNGGLFQLPGDVFSSPIVWDSFLFVGCRDDYFYCLKIEAQ